jgi:hypothetical protein
MKLLILGTILSPLTGGLVQAAPWSKLPQEVEAVSANDPTREEHPPTNTLLHEKRDDTQRPFPSEPTNTPHTSSIFEEVRLLFLFRIVY